MTGKYVHFYEEIYRNRDDYKRELNLLYNNIMAFLPTPPKSMLDYGCGTGDLTTYFENNHQTTIVKYDPAIPEYATLPNGHFDLVTNTDVLEHIPEDELDDILSKIASYGRNAFFSIHLFPAREILSNGENAHCTLKAPEWWRSKIEQFFGKAYLVPSYYEKACCIITWEADPLK